MFKLRFLVLGMISLFIILFLINCEKDKIPIADEEGHEHIADLPFTIKSIPFHEVEEESAVRKKLDEFEKALEKERNKSNEPDWYDFTIETEFASYIKSNVSNYHSYTFAIKREYDYGPLENLLLSVQPDSSYKAFLVKYDFTFEEKQAFIDGDFFDLEDRVRVIELNMDNLTVSLNSKTFTCVTMLQERCKCYEHNSETGYADCNSYCYELTVVSTGCVGAGGSGSGTGTGGSTGDGGEGSGDTGGGTGTNGSGGGTSGSGSTGTIDVTTPTTCKRNCPPEMTIEYQHCQKLHDMLDPAKANIKQTITDLEGTLNQTGENGAVFKKSDGAYTNLRLPARRGRSIDIPVGNNIYGAIHTHPFTGLPLFSYRDVFALLSLYDNAALSVKSEVTLMLISKDAHGTNQMFALKVNNINVFRNKIYTKLGINSNTPDDKVKRKLDAFDQILGEVYDEYLDPERAFLNFFKDYNISLYKADENRNSFSKLSLPDPNSNSTAIVKTDCNEIN